MGTRSGKMTGVPGYFCPMLLCDPARTQAYREAITAAVRDFRQANADRAPRVLDLGCGSGLLGVLALRAGAAAVTSVDVNSSCLRMTREVAARWDGVAKWTVAEGGPDFIAAHRGAFDMIVTEMMGTLVFAEDMERTLQQYRSVLDPRAAGGPYVVPSAARQFVCRVTLPEGWLRTALEQELARHASFVGTNSLNLHPACCDFRRVGERVVVYESGSVVALAARFTCGAHEFLLCEWECTLWRDVVIENTLDGYRALPFANAVGRECEWGFAIAAPPATQPVRVALVMQGDDEEPTLQARTDDGAWDVEGLIAGSQSLAYLLPDAHEHALRLRVARDDVMVETAESTCIVPFVEALCKERGLEEPWHQQNVARAWTMEALGTAREFGDDEAGRLDLAVLPDVHGERASEMACRHNDDRFASAASTTAQLRQLMRALGGDEQTHVTPALPDDDLVWQTMVLPVEDELEAAALEAPLRSLEGYAALTRHGMLSDEHMPGLLAQSLPLLLTRDTTQRGVRLRVAHADGTDPKKSWEEDRGRTWRMCASALSRGGAAVVLDA